MSAAAQNSRGWWGEVTQSWLNPGGSLAGLTNLCWGPQWNILHKSREISQHCEDIERNLTEKSVPTRCIEIECRGVADDIWIMLNDPYLCSKLSVWWTKSITNYGLFMFPNCHQGGGLGWAGLGWAGLGTSPIPWSRPDTWDTDNGEDTGQGLVMITLTSVSWPQFIVY